MHPATYEKTRRGIRLTRALRVGSGLDWGKIASSVASLINDGAPVAEQFLPEFAPAIQIAAKLLTAAANAEPVAASLVKSIQSGQVPSPADLQTFATDYEDAYQALHADLAEKIASTPPT